MQTKNPTPSGTTALATTGGGSGAIKSFTDLGGKLIEKEIDSFADQVRKGIDNWRTAGKILVELSTRQPDIFRLIQARHPAISIATLQTFARIGRNELWPPLLVDSSLGARKLLECPYDVQKEYSEKLVPVVIAWDGKTIKKTEKKLGDLTRAECAIVFKQDGGMNTEEQQAWRLASNGKASLRHDDMTLKDTDPAPDYKPARMVNVDIGYFEIVIDEEGVVMCDPCGKSATAQPVRVIQRDGTKTAVVVFYKQEMK